MALVWRLHLCAGWSLARAGGLSSLVLIPGPSFSWSGLFCRLCFYCYFSCVRCFRVLVLASLTILPFSGDWCTLALVRLIVAARSSLSAVSGLCPGGSVLSWRRSALASSILVLCAVSLGYSSSAV